MRRLAHASCHAAVSANRSSTLGGARPAEARRRTEGVACVSLCSPAGRRSAQAFPAVRSFPMREGAGVRACPIQRAGRHPTGRAGPGSSGCFGRRNRPGASAPAALLPRSAPPDCLQSLEAARSGVSPRRSSQELPPLAISPCCGFSRRTCGRRQVARLSGLLPPPKARFSLASDGAASALTAEAPNPIRRACLATTTAFPQSTDRHGYLRTNVLLQAYYFSVSNPNPYLSAR